MSAKKYISRPLYEVIGEMAALWTMANIGYYLVLPAFGFNLSYNTSPVIISIYFLIWAIITILTFWRVYSNWLVIDSSIWLYSFLSFASAVGLFVLVYLFSFLPEIDVSSLLPYSDFFLASPRYFLPKAFEILVQQLLITVLVVELFFRLKKIKEVVIGYALFFGGAHIVLYLLNDSSFPYSMIMIISAFLSSLVFPYLILRVRGGFIYAYVIHFVFYILLATMFHLLPPPGFVI